MKNHNIQDERVLAQKRKIGSDAFELLFYGLLLSVLVQQFVFNAPFIQYAVEFILFIVSSVYILIRNLMIGNDIFSSNNSGQKIVILNSLVCGFTVSIINTALNYIKLGNLFTTDSPNIILISLFTFICATATAFFAFEILYIANKRRKQQIDSKFSDEDE
jgi:hypothetical protein